MSRVTDLVLITGFSEDTYLNPKLPVKKLNDYLRQNYGREFARVDSYAGGDKGFCSAVYLCAINYLHLKNLLGVFRDCDWLFGDTTLLMYKGEHDDRYTICTPRGNEIQVNQEDVS